MFYLYNSSFVEQHSVMKRFLELSVYFLNSVHPELRQSYHEFMDMLPCLVTTFSMNGIASVSQ